MQTRRFPVEDPAVLANLTKHDKEWAHRITQILSNSPIMTPNSDSDTDFAPAVVSPVPQYNIGGKRSKSTPPTTPPVARAAHHSPYVLISLKAATFIK